MAERKTKTNKPAKTVKKITATKKEQPKKVVEVQRAEQMFYAHEIAEILCIPTFEYYIVKSKNNIDDGALLTVSQFKEMYQKAIEGR